MSGEPLDTRVTNGRFVDGRGQSMVSLTIHDGVIVAGHHQDDVWRTVNASGHLVLPGLIQPGSPEPDAALALVRGGVTTVLAPLSRSEPSETACIDFVPASELPVATVEISSETGELSDAEWDLLLGDQPLHVTAPAVPGFPVIHFLYHEGHVSRGMTLERIADITSRHAAAALGLQTLKGGFECGAHGDLFVFDPDTADPYRELRWPGRVIFSLQRGNILLYNGQIHSSPGDGRLLEPAWRAASP